MTDLSATVVAAAVPARPGEADWAAAVGAVRGLRPTDKVLLICHVNPDGDALGSMLGLAHALRARGTTVCPSFSEPFEVPDSLAGLPGTDLLVPPREVPAEPPLLVTFDAGSADPFGGNTIGAHRLALGVRRTA